LNWRLPAPGVFLAPAPAAGVTLGPVIDGATCTNASRSTAGRGALIRV
jgi:hypothetical protein